ncbi:transcriptional regulator, Crp/Fnr family [Formosa agariphila KMM 3901]|uniref:Transcriptional regulator, Crp/Fnr family n=1 Tax=Formosa agariphila (strain DSM 15362 / KCTC 12365 / LMG 23005 / KMM 3901 / M-2Alg 35-1) TaxID=1347342 RepID=T2KIG5_FORAG|nr:Crp/Fnr family transcriptional regulator [Formosa agariphila]CDF78595.1 transcriptional regulator, Crp/Fnr family [Formosa agariphila KMM 3901]
MSTVWFFEDVNLFKMLCPHKFKAYKKDHAFKAYKKKDYIYFEEDASNKIFLIEQGKVKIGYYNEDGEEIVKAILAKGELFGEKAILGEAKREEFAQSLDNTTSICPIGVETMYDLMRNNQSFSFKVYKFIGLKFKKLERRLQLLLFKDSKTRLKEFIDELCADSGYSCPNTGDTIICHHYTQSDIASLIGTSRPTLNILLNELKEENYLEFHRKEIRILKKAA